jgi:ADP-ribosyl-[dinitrogen reductase] hydrolase
MAALSARDRVGGALWGMFIGDALSMPVHWIYSPESLRSEYGVVRDYLAPKRSHPSSIMSLHSADRAGRKAYGGNAAGPRKIVGDVILKGKRHLWEEPKLHYHFGLKAGDNTLNLLVARVLMRSIAASGRYDADHFLKEYIGFMTAGTDFSAIMLDSRPFRCN